MKTVQFRHSTKQLYKAHAQGLVNAIAALNLKEINAIALYDANRRCKANGETWAMLP